MFLTRLVVIGFSLSAGENAGSYINSVITIAPVKEWDILDSI